VLAARLRSPNSDIGDSVLGALREATDDDRKLPSPSANSASYRSDDPLLACLERAAGIEPLSTVDRGVGHSLGLLDLVDAMKEVGRDLLEPPDDRSI
jgi:hypothetical protein